MESIEVEKLIFLDYKKYPNSDEALRILKSKYEVIVLDVEKDWSEIEETITNLNYSYYHSLVPSVIELMEKRFPNIKSVLPSLTTEEIIEMKDFIKTKYPKLGISRMKLTMDHLDPLKLARLYEESPSLSVKIQTNGMPFINQYSGMESFLTIDKLNAGLVTPATKAESDSVNSLAACDNHDYVIQSIRGELYMVKIIERQSNDLTWYEVETFEVPDDLYECLTKFAAKSCYFIYLRSLKSFKVSAIFSGINYHIDPKLYV